MNDAEYFADELRVGDVPLLVGDTMLLHYDFGDDWRFQVTLESIGETNLSKAKTRKVIAESGESSAQYDHDDW